MTLELTAAERELLLDILVDRRGSLREQIHHSMTSSFTDELKQTLELLNGLIARIETGESAA